MKKENFCDIYVARIPSGEMVFESLYPESREAEVAGVRNERVRREKYFVWRLFALALKKSLDINIKDLEIKKNANGKWLAEGISFSLSHGGDAVAVALSSGAVGIDIEPLSAVKNENIAKRVLTEREMLELDLIPENEKREYIVKKWTAKEAIFKSLDEPTFSPGTIEVSEYGVVWKDAVICGEKYVIAAFNENACEPNVFLDFSL